MSKNVLEGPDPLHAEYTFDPFDMSKMSNITLCNYSVQKPQTLLSTLSTWVTIKTVKASFDPFDMSNMSNN